MFLSQFMLGLHCVNDDADEQVQNGEAVHEYEWNKEQPRQRILFHHWPDNTHRPTLKGHDLKKGIHACADVTEPVREQLSEEVGRQNGTHIEQQENDGTYGEDAGNCSEQCSDHLAHLRYHADQRTGYRPY